MIGAVGKRKLPYSTAAFLFTDVNGWTRLLPGMAPTRSVPTLSRRYPDEHPTLRILAPTVRSGRRRNANGGRT